MPKKGYKSVPWYYQKEIEIPEEWDVKRIGNTGEFVNGLNKKKEDYGHGCLHVNIDNIFESFVIDPTKVGRVNATNDEITRYSLQEGDICLLRSSVKREGIGYPALFQKNNKPVVFSGFIIRFRPNQKIWNCFFLTYTLRAEIMRKLVISRSTSSANTNINQPSYGSIQICIPSLLEQQKIASILSNVDNLIQNTDKLIEKTTQLKKGLIQELLSRGIGHTKFKKVPWYYQKEIEIPEEWEVELLRNMCKVRQGLQIPISDRHDENGKNRFQYITVKAIHSNIFNEFIENPGKRVVCTKKDILFARTGNTGEIITDIEGVFHNNFFLVDFDNKQLTKDYLVISLKQPTIQGIIQSLSGTTTIPDLNHGDFFRLKITIPPLPEQQKIASILSNTDEKIQSYERYKEKLQRLKTSLMQKLLTGEVRVAV